MAAQNAQTCTNLFTQYLGLLCFGVWAHPPITCFHVIILVQSNQAIVTVAQCIVQVDSVMLQAQK